MRRHTYYVVNESADNAIPLPLYEQLRQQLDSIDVSAIPRLGSFDTTTGPLFSYGRTYDQYIDFLDKVFEIVRKDHTLTRRMVYDARQVFVETDFFVNASGFYIDRKQSIKNLLAMFRALCNQAERYQAISAKSNLIKHNQKLLETMFSDMLHFSRSLAIDKLPTDQVGNT